MFQTIRTRGHSQIIQKPPPPTRHDRGFLNFGAVALILGIILIVSNKYFVLKLNPAGELFALLDALFWSLYGFIIVFLSKKYHILFITRKVFFYSSLSLFLFIKQESIVQIYHLLDDITLLSNMLFLGIIGSMLSYVMWNFSVDKIGIVKTFNYYYLMPLVTLFISCVFFDEKITIIGMFGSVLTLIGVYLGQKTEIHQ